MVFILNNYILSAFFRIMTSWKLLLKLLESDGKDGIWKLFSFNLKSMIKDRYGFFLSRYILIAFPTLKSLGIEDIHITFKPKRSRIMGTRSFILIHGNYLNGFSFVFCPSLHLPSLIILSHLSSLP